ncbi:Ser/Thr protein kinase [Corchorus capsularis]|uniref:Ser/Thr protein kinase n=1 Tax=Corchorus capsularis TaxID=210143 RepID=A0A1R3HWR9_COCAP|nr:Ser/Thr protein kinase [Corchorus capsularis]
MDIQVFTVARTDYLTNLCPQQLINTTFSFSLLRAWNLENVTLYYDCPRIVSPSSGFPSQFNCSNRGTGLINYFVVESAFQNLSAEVKGELSTCQNNVVVPAFYTAAQSIATNPTPDTVILPLRNGFGLKWNEKFYSKCQACNASGGVCGFDSIEFLCYCSDHTDSSNCLQSGV